MFTKKFLLALLERAVKTFAQAAGAMLIATGTGLLDTDWLGVLSVAAMAAIASVLLNVGIGAFTDGGPSIGSVEEIAPDYSKYAAPEDGAVGNGGITQAPTGGQVHGPDETDPPVG